MLNEENQTLEQEKCIIFYTYSLPCFNYYHELFYEDKVKRIPLDIGELLNLRGLAIWAQDDGNKKGPGFHLNTQSYTKNENLLLIKILKDIFDLDCTLNISISNNDKAHYRIYIKKL